MSNETIAPQQLLDSATELAKSNGNMEIIDRVTILHGYLELTRLDPGNYTYRQNVEDAAHELLEATRASGLSLCSSVAA